MKKIRKWLLLLVLLNVIFISGFLYARFRKTDRLLKEERSQMLELAGENVQITGGGYDPGLAVTCDNGTFVGLEKNKVCSWKGIPYAEPPVGSYRWMPPVDAGPDAGIYEAYYFGKSGIQTETASERASLYPRGEDCLTLNIWSSTDGAADDADHVAHAYDADDSSTKAVMVFFPGGAYGWGGTADPLYDGQNFVEAHRDIVLVTVNYRIGLMGFIDFSEVEGGEEYEKSGNLGLLDQISALRWIRRNIKAFGGDPENVTIFGESAGGSSVSFLPLIDDARGLFRRVIAQSGSIAFSYSRRECQDLTRMLLKEAKASSMEDLLALSEEDLIKINEKLNDHNNFPERDGIVLPGDVYAAYEAGEASDVDMLTGTNADEAQYWIGEVGGYAVYRLAGRLLYGGIREQLDEEDRRLADAFLALQPAEDIWAKTEFINDLLFRVPAIRQAQSHAGNGGRHYMYYWTKESDLAHYGACHAVELAYVFNNTEDTIYTGKPADTALARTVQEMWVNFARTGDPSTAEIQWPVYEADTRQTMVLGDECGPVSDPLAQQRVLVEPLLTYRFNGNYMIVDYSLIYLRNRFTQNLLLLVGINAIIFLIVFILKKKKKHS